MLNESQFSTENKSANDKKIIIILDCRMFSSTAIKIQKTNYFLMLLQAKGDVKNCLSLGVHFSEVHLKLFMLQVQIHNGWFGYCIILITSFIFRQCKIKKHEIKKLSPKNTKYLHQENTLMTQIVSCFFGKSSLTWLNLFFYFLFILWFVPWGGPSLNVCKQLMLCLKTGVSRVV